MFTTNLTLGDKSYDAEKSEKSENAQKKVDITIECSNDSIYIMPKGYGDANSSDGGGGCPIMIEIWEGQLRLVAWADINKQDPTHIISMEKAQESLRGVVEVIDMPRKELDQLRRDKMDIIWEDADLGLEAMGWEYADDSGWEHISPSDTYSKMFFYYTSPDTDDRPSSTAWFTVRFKKNSVEVESAEPTFKH